MLSIKIGKETFRVERASSALCAMAGVFGLFDPNKNMITIDENLGGEKLVEVVLHEVQHAFWRVYKWRKCKQEKNCIRQGEAMAAFFRDNPKFVKKLLMLTKP